jgi:protein-tyrosine phosphatase
MDLTEIISEQLWIGPAPSRSELETLKNKYGPKLAVLDLTRNPTEEESCNELHLEYDSRIPRIEDDYSPISIPRLKLVSRIIDDNISQGRKVFLHCQAGIGRSPTCAVAYLVHCGTSLLEAKDMVQSKRQIWQGRDAEYAGHLEEFAKIQEISRVENPSFL